MTSMKGSPARCPAEHLPQSWETVPKAESQVTPLVEPACMQFIHPPTHEKKHAKPARQAQLGMLGPACTTSHASIILTGA